MSQNDAVQWTIVGIIILIDIIWVIVKMLNFGRKADTGCNCCELSKKCKTKEIKEHFKGSRDENCHDGRSARN